MHHPLDGLNVNVISRTVLASERMIWRDHRSAGVQKCSPPQMWYALSFLLSYPALIRWLEEILHQLIGGLFHCL